MKERKETISITKANIWSFGLIAAAALVGTPYYMIVARLMGRPIQWSHFFDFFNSDHPVALPMLGYMISFWLLIIGGAVVHELVHGITWALCSPKGWRSISFGVMWKMLTPYCHCSVPLKRNHYIIGGLMPLFVVGLLPLLVAPFVDSLALFVFGLIYVGGAAGDLMVVFRLCKEDPASTILDHPTEAGYLVYEEENGEGCDKHPL